MARPPTPVWARMAICSRTSWPRPAMAATRSSSGRRTKTRSMSSSMVAVSSDIDSALGSSGLKAGSPASEASAVVQLRGDRAEAAELGQEGRRIGGDLIQRQLPAADGVGEEALRDAQRGAEGPALVLVPPLQRGDVRELAAGEELQHLELGIDAGLQAPEHLEHGLVAEHDRRVGLLDAHRAHRRVERAAGRSAPRAGSGRCRPRPRASARRRSGAAARAPARGRRRRRPPSSPRSCRPPGDRRPGRRRATRTAAGRARGCRRQTAPGRG